MATHQIVTVSLRSITTSHNPRRPCAKLQDALAAEGYENYSMLDLVHELALSDDPDKRAEFCRLIETYDGAEISDGLVSLAKSRAENEIQPILLRDFRSKNKNDEYETRYGVVAGERRCLAAAYNYAKHGIEPSLGAQIRKLTVAEAYDLAVEENAQRRPMSDMEYGRIFAGYRSETNPKTGKKWSLKEIALKLNLDYQFVRGREALTFLSDSEQQKLDSGKTCGIGLTKAIVKGLALKRGRASDADVSSKPHRQRTLNLAETQALFDKSYESSANASYLQALADVMQVSLDEAIDSCKVRIESKNRVA